MKVLLRVFAWRVHRWWLLLPRTRMVGGFFALLAAFAAFSSGAGVDFPILGALSLIASVFLGGLSFLFWTAE